MQRWEDHSPGWTASLIASLSLSSSLALCSNDVRHCNGPLTSKTKAKSQIRREPCCLPPSSEHCERTADFHHFIMRLFLHTWPHSLVIEQEMSLIVASCLHASNRLCSDRRIASIHSIWASLCLLYRSSPAVVCCVAYSLTAEWNHPHVSDLCLPLMILLLCAFRHKGQEFH